MTNPIATRTRADDQANGTSQTSAVEQAEPHEIQRATQHALRPIGRLGQNVNAHRIEFETTEPKDLLCAVVGASRDVQAIHNSIQNLAPRLQELVTLVQANTALPRPKGITAYKTIPHLVSFGSPTSRQRVAKAHQTLTFTTDSFKPNSTSMVEQMYAALASVPAGQAVSLSASLRLNRLQLESNPTSPGALSGHIHLQHLEGGKWKPLAVKFHEFSPEYNGKSLSAAVLLESLDQLNAPEGITENGFNQMSSNIEPHFYSANGIGRSASLAVLCTFQKSCELKGGFQGTDLDTHVKSLVDQGRQQRGKDFINTSAQFQELLNACEAINQRVMSKPSEVAKESNGFNEPAAFTSPAPVPGLRTERTASPSLGPTIHADIIKLSSDIPEGVVQADPSLPYMPIRVEGILDISNRPDEFPFPELSTDQAKQYSSDVVHAGFYGDALGAELEGRPFQVRLGILNSSLRTKLNERSKAEQAQLKRRAQTLEGKENMLVRQMHNQNIYPKLHRATDDTQQGVLSALAKMGWLLNNNDDLNQLPANISDSFCSPQLPLQSFNNGQGQTGAFNIRGGAATLNMCQRRADKDWRDRCISELHYQQQNQRAGGAGNGSMMRIGYDLLPLLGSKASMQNLVEQALLSNQVTHPSSLSAVASVGQVVLLAKCMHLRAQAELNGKPIEIPEHFFINTFYEVAKALEGPQRFTLELDNPNYPRLNKVFAEMQPQPDEETQLAWTTERLPSEILNGPSEQHTYTAAQAKAITRSSVKQALLDCTTRPNTYIDKEAILQRWNSRSYLGATLPSVVFLMESYGYTDPARAVTLAALLTQDSDTCATIVAQVMGALHGPKWIPHTKELGFDDMLGNGFYPVQQFVGDLHAFYDKRGQK